MALSFFADKIKSFTVKRTKKTNTYPREEIKELFESAKIQDVTKWCEKFENEGIDLDALKCLNDDDLKELGMAKKGERVKLLKEIKVTPDAQRNTSLEEEEENGSADAYDDIPFEVQHIAVQTLEAVASLKRRSGKILICIYEDILKLFQNNEISIDLQDEVQAEFGNIPKLVSEKIAELNEDELPIVITGETSAGKSSFVNLLIGVDLLPKSALACTSTICRIHNRSTKEIYLTDIDGIKKRVEEFDETIKDINALKEILSKYVSINKQKQQSENYKFVDIYWPIPNLPREIMIVDTPGLSPDSPELTKMLFSYLKEALAFIYLLNTPNAGGVQSDRILKIYNEITNGMNDTEGQFDPKRALFICHKWDQIHEHPDVVFETVKSTLHESWKGFDKDKLFKLSSLEEMENHQKGTEKISSDYRAVLNEMSSMMPETIKERTRRHLCWQGSVMERVSKHLITRMICTIISREDMLGRLNEMEKTLEQGKWLKSVMIATLKELTEVNIQYILESLHTHIDSESVRKKLFSWSNKDLIDNDDMERVDDHIRNQALARINDELRSGFISEIIHLTREIGEKMFHHLLEIEEKIDEMDEIFVQNIIELDNEVVTDIKLNTFTKVMIEITAPVTIPVGLAAGLIGIIIAIPKGIGVKIQSVIDNAMKRKLYKKDKIQYAWNISNEYLDNLLIKKFLFDLKQNLEETLESRIHQYLSTVIDGKIKGREKQIENLKKDIPEPKSYRQQCQESENYVKPIYGHIQYAFIKLFEQIVVKRSDVKLIQASNDWLAPCKIKHNEHWVETQPLPKSLNLTEKYGWQELAEISLLREMKHPNVLQIYGISTFIFPKEDGLVLYEEIYTERLDKIAMKKDFRWNVCRLLLEDVLKGLSYLHVHGHVHKNLRLESIAVLEKNGRYTGKLCMGNRINCSKLTGKIEGIPLIVAPEVRSTGCYGYEADIFQFGFVFWESLNKRRAFWLDGKSAFPTYEALYQYLEIDGRPEIINLIGSQMVKKCWSSDPNERPPAIYVVENLRYTYTEYK